MTIKRRLQFFVFGSICLTILLSSIGLVSIVLDKVYSIEKDLLQRDIYRAKLFLVQEQSNLSLSTNDWALWDDTYKYMQDGNQGFIDSNMSGSVLSILNIHFMGLYKNDLVIYNYLIAETDNNIISVELQQITDSVKKIIKLKEGTASTANASNGILCIRGQCYLFALNGISNSEGSAPRNGSLIMLRNIDEHTAADLTGMLDSKAKIEVIGPGQVLGDTELFYDPVGINDTTLSGYSIISDAFGQPSLKLSVIHERTIMKEARTVLPILVGLLIVVAMISGGSYYFFMQKDVINNLSKIMKFIQGISTRTDVQKPELQGDFGKVVETINTLTTDLSNKEKELENNNQMLIKVNNDLQTQQSMISKSNMELQEMNNAMVGRELKMVELKKEIERLKTNLGQPDQAATV
jgi:sensor domain CHASE-containing protein